MIDHIYMFLSNRLDSAKQYFRICPPGYPLCNGPNGHTQSDKSNKNTRFYRKKHTFLRVKMYSDEPLSAWVVALMDIVDIIRIIEKPRYLFAPETLR